MMSDTVFTASKVILGTLVAVALVLSVVRLFADTEPRIDAADAGTSDELPVSEEISEVGE